MQNKYLSIIAIILSYIAFAIYIYFEHTEYLVLKINSSSNISIDLNRNGQVDNDENICIPDIITADNIPEIAKQFNISKETELKLNYLASEFAKNSLLNKKVKVEFTNNKTNECKFANIYIKNESYKEKLFNAGFAITNFDNSNEFKSKIKEAEKLDLVILNHNSNKYHKLDCKYGQVARDAVLIPLKQLPLSTTPCKYCHIPQNTSQKSNYPDIISNQEIKMYLTDFTTQLKPDKKCTTSVCKEIVTQINNSTKTIDIALYGYKTIPEIETALANAKQRGVKINVVYNTSKNNYYPETQKVLNFANRTSTDDIKKLMHNKFIIFDDLKVITGSMNFAPTGFSGFNSNCIFLINSSEIAQIYKQEFNQMLSGQFHNEKNIIETKTINLNETQITPYFSPKHKIITKKIIPLIDNAQKYIYIPTFLLTHDELASALINAHKRNVEIKIITDATNISSARSKIDTLREADIKVKCENYAGKMHAKTILIDDKYIIAGSMNFSNSGENKNDENCLIIENKKLTKNYKDFFLYLWNKIPDKYLKENPSAESKYSIGSCSDGIDNDYDGKIDLADEACKL